MLQFIFTNVLMISIGAMLYLAARSLPRLAEEDGGAEDHSMIERWVMSDIPHRLDLVLNSYAGKLFRKLKILSLRFDNYLTNRIKRLNAQSEGLSGQSKPKIDFEQVMEVRTTDYVGPDRRKVNERRKQEEVL